MLSFGGKAGKMWLCSMASFLSSSAAELSVTKPGHTSKSPGCWLWRDDALSLGANQHECACIREFARDGKVERVRGRQEWRRWRREWRERETADG